MYFSSASLCFVKTVACLGPQLARFWTLSEQNHVLIQFCIPSTFAKCQCLPPQKRLLNGWTSLWIQRVMFFSFPVLPQVQKLMRKKQLDVADFSVYWDAHCTLLGDLPQVELQVGFWQKAVWERSTEVECGAPAAEVSVLCGPGRHSHDPLPLQASSL